MTKPEILAKVWSRLQWLSCEHAALLHADGGATYTFSRRRQIGVPEVIKENVEILGRCDEEEIKARLSWYLTYHPELFGRMLKAA